MTDADGARLMQAQEDLVAWGVLDGPPVLAPTRRFRSAIARAAARLREQELSGRHEEGHPLERVVALALETHPLPPDAEVRREHQMLVVAVELASLPEEIRTYLGGRV